jgi:hypothetical protein
MIPYGNVFFKASARDLCMMMLKLKKWKKSVKKILETSDVGIRDASNKASTLI